MTTDAFRIAQRAKAIFQKLHPGDGRWGENNQRGTSSFRLEIAEAGGSGETLQILSEEQRQPYIDQAREELAAEAAALSKLPPR